MVGIASIGCYFPRRRLLLRDIATASQWQGAPLSKLPTGARSVCSWDEDEVTMAVSAAQRCLRDFTVGKSPSIYYGASKAAHSARQSSSVIADALSISGTHASDTTGIRAGTAVLLHAIKAVKADGTPALAITSERRRPVTGSRFELASSDGATAALLTEAKGIAQFVGAKSINVDFVTQFREEDRQVGYLWEDRWIIEEGYLKLMSPLVTSLLSDLMLSPNQIDLVAWHCPYPRARKQLAERLGLNDRCQFVGETRGSSDIGSGLALELLAAALEVAQPGQKILVLNFGQGCDALLFEATSEPKSPKITGYGPDQDAGIPVSYEHFLVLAGLVETDRGLKAEVDNFTSLSLRHRHADLLLRFTGGRCRQCGIPQIPRSLICVNPACNGVRTQDPYSFADCQGRLLTWSADHLAATDTPPAFAGLVDFEGGGRLMMDLIDFHEGELFLGASVLPSFRVRAHDLRRGFTSYFWKAAPYPAPQS